MLLLAKELLQRAWTGSVKHLSTKQLWVQSVLRAGTGRVKHRSTEQLWVQTVLRAGTERVKHLSTEQLWVQAVLERLSITVQKIPRRLNYADVLTSLSIWTRKPKIVSSRSNSTGAGAVPVEEGVFICNGFHAAPSGA